MAAVGRHLFGKSSGRDRLHRLSQLLLDAVDHSIEHRSRSIDDAAVHCIDRIAPDNTFGWDEVDVRQQRSLAGKCFQRQPQSRCPLQLTAKGKLLPHQQPQQAGFSTAVPAVQGNLVPCTNCKANRFKQLPSVKADGKLSCLQKRFGVIEGVTDKGYITNSYHVHVTEPIDAFKKLEFEAQFQHLSPGGAISYVEVPDMQNNLDAVLEVMKFIYDHIIYAELNTKSDYCQVCGWDGEIEVVEEDGKLIWKCPQCGNTDQDKMNVARRTCGYIGTQFWNQGRTQEIKDRVLHL